MSTQIGSVFLRARAQSHNKVFDSVRSHGSHHGHRHRIYMGRLGVWPFSAPLKLERHVKASAQKQQFSSFDSLVQESHLPVLVDFYAVWCGPCMMLGKVLDNVAPLVKDKVKFVKIDTEKYTNIAEKYNVHALPTLVLFKNGKQVDRIEGYLTEVDLRLWLNRKL